MTKISFLIAAHNEERIISQTLANLANLPYRDYEVIVGLDGCTDNTEIIVKNFARASNKIKYYSVNIRRGKPAVINFIIKKARGDIIAINDADWIFSAKNKAKLNKLLEVFEDPAVGGMAESFPAEWDSQKLKSGNIWFKMVAYSSYFWLKFQKETFTYREGQFNYLKRPEMFLTNIFRRKLYKENRSLGDDFERTYDIMSQGYKIAILDDETMPRMIVSYNKLFLKDLFKQKIRTAVARKQISELHKIGLFDYYLPSVIYILKESFRKKMTIVFLMLFWVFITSLGQVLSKFSRYDTKKGWTLRARR